MNTMQITIYNIPYIFPATFMYRTIVLKLSFEQNAVTNNEQKIQSNNISISQYQYFELHLLSRSLY